MSVLLSETSSHYQPAANPPLRLKFSLIPPLKIRLPNYRIQERLSNAPNSTKKPGHLSHHHGLPIGGRRQKGLSYPGQPIKRLKLVFKSQKSPMLASAPFSKASIRVSSKSIAQKPRRGRRGRAVTKTAASAALRTPRSKRKRDDTAIQLYKSTPSQPLDISPVEKEPPVSTKEKAHSMLKWALLKNPVLTRDFEVRQFLGWGGCGCVLGAIRRSDLQQCAIKMIYRNAQPTSERSTHSTEISVLQSISHPHIVSFLESFKDDKCYYLVMEQFGFCWRPAASASEMIVIPTAIEGTTKHSLLSVCNGSSASLFDYIDEMGCIPAYLVRDLFKQLALALGYLHGIGIVHGDIKEENILVGITQENRHIVKLCDFGHARQTKRNHPDLRFYGTRDVSAPELLQNLWSCKPESELSQVFYGYEQDVWALGLVLYTMIHGTLPENNESLVNGDESLTGVSVYPVFFSSGMEKSCLDLLQKMLTIDHHKRITMDGVLNHPFLKRCGIYD